MAIVESIQHIENFEKEYDSTKPIAFRAGAEGSATGSRFIVLLDNQTINSYNTQSQTKKEITKDELLNGTMMNLLEKLVIGVYQNMRYQEANMKNEDYTGPATVTTIDVAADKIASLNTVYERCQDHLSGKDIKLIASKKQARANFDEPVKNNIGLLTFTEQTEGNLPIKKGDMYIIDVVLEKDSSGGLKIQYK